MAHPINGQAAVIDAVLAHASTGTSPTVAEWVALRTLRNKLASCPDRNMSGADEFVTALLMQKPIWPNEWGQDVSAAAFFLTDGGKRSTAQTRDITNARIMELRAKHGEPFDVLRFAHELLHEAKRANGEDSGWYTN